jgi:hypothetical protein
MTSAAPSAEPRHIARPVLRAGRLRCPRCDAPLQFDREEYVCLLCGYEYLPEPEELARYRGRGRARELAAGIAVVALSLDGLAIIGVVLVAAVLVLPPLARRLGWRRAGR